MSKSKNTLSKSTLIRSIQCPKSLYLYKKNYDLRDKTNYTQQQVFDRGHRVGKLAHLLFPNGRDCSPPNPYSYDESITATKLLVRQQFPVIYEACFKHNGILVALDMLTYENGKWYAHEVKSSMRISNTYLQDAAIQYYIITKSGVELEDFFIVNINSDYVLDETLNVQQFFKSTTVLNEIKERIPFIEATIEKAIATLNLPEAPEVPIGVHCNKPYPCDFQGLCWTTIEKDSVWYLPGISMQEKNNLVEKGIEKIDQIIITEDLNERQKVIIQTYQQNQIYKQEEKLTAFLHDINYPLYFFDVEAFQPAIPLFKGTQPYQRIPFLYSLHYKESADSELIHIDYISEVGEDAREKFIRHFLDATKKTGQILVFNTLMEKSVLFKLANDFPQYKDEIFLRIKRIVDFEIPFKELHYYHPKQQGSFSLKAIGNAILGEDEFAKSTVKDGEEAMSLYNELFYFENKNEIPEKLNYLKKYCQTDTLVLYKIFEKLKQ
ncbi:MAG: DUF2779 domain-containing protein [Chitinophagales bacterium]